MMEKFLEQSPPGIRRWWYRHEIEEHVEAVERAQRNFDESKAWAAQKLIERQEVQQAYKEFKKRCGLEDDG